MLVHVSEKHIAEGKKCSPWFCPAVLALNEATGDSWTVTEDYFRKNGRMLDTKIPDALESFVRKFDSGEKVEPFSFVIQE